MQITDTIADLRTRIRNASSAKHDTVEVPASNAKKAICQILVDEGYVKSFSVTEDGKQGMIKIVLKYAEGKTRPAHLFRRRRNAQGYERPGRSHCFHFEGHHDRPSGPQRKHWRRSAGICLVR